MPRLEAEAPVFRPLAAADLRMIMSFIIHVAKDWPCLVFQHFVIKALVDAIAGGAANDTQAPLGIDRTGPKIEQFFLDCGLDMRVGANSRVPATTDFLRNVARQWGRRSGLGADHRSCRQTLATIYPSLKKGQAVLESLNTALEPDGLAVVIVSGKPQLVEKGAAGISLKAFVEKVALLDFDTVQRDIERALSSVKSDPEDAVTSACSLIEAVCRSILIELSIPLPPKKDVHGAHLGCSRTARTVPRTNGVVL